MSETQFTPAAWRFYKQEETSIRTGKLFKTVWWLDSDTRKAMASMEVWGLSEHASEANHVEYEQDLIEVQANANLIAAAPDLYAALERFVNDCNEPQLADLNKQIEREASLFMAGEQALAKARGEQK